MFFYIYGRPIERRNGIELGKSVGENDACDLLA